MEEHLYRIRLYTDVVVCASSEKEAMTKTTEDLPFILAYNIGLPAEEIAQAKADGPGFKIDASGALIINDPHDLPTGFTVDDIPFGHEDHRKIKVFLPQ